MTLVLNATELSSALAAAVGGEVFELASGNYGVVSINQSYATDVTVRSLDITSPAEFTGLSINGGSHIIIDSVFCDYTHTPGDPTWHKPFAVFNSSFITIRNCIFDGAEVLSASGVGSFGFGYGLYIEFSDDIVVEFNEVYNFERAVNIGTGTNIIFRGNDLHSCRSEGVDFWNMHTLLVDGNYIHDLKKDPSTGDHPDLIQFWDVKTNEWSEDVTIRGNFLVGGAGWTQSIFIQNTIQAAGEEFHNFLIEHNVIYNAHSHGITCEGGFDGITIRNNTMLYAPAASDPTNQADLPPFINVNTSNVNVTILDNVLEKRWNWDQEEASVPAWSVAGQFHVQRNDSAGAGYYGNEFVNALVPNATLADLRAVAGGTIETLGVGADLTRMGFLLHAGPGGTVAPPSSDPPPPPPDPDPEPSAMLISDLIVNLIDADFDIVDQALVDGDFVDPAFLASGAATIAVEAAPSAPAIGSVRLTVGAFSRTESSAPYALFGDNLGDYTGGLILAEGPQLLRLEVFSGSGASGTVLGDFTIGFTVGVEAPAPPPPTGIDPAVQAALDAMDLRLVVVEATAAFNGSDIELGDAADAALDLRVSAVESRLAAGAAGLIS